MKKKTGWWWFKSYCLPATKHDLEKLEKLITMTEQELSDLLDRQTTQIGKIAKEQSDRFDALTLKIKELTDAINSGELPAGLAEKATAVQAALDSLDAAIPDAPTP